MLLVLYTLIGANVNAKDHVWLTPLHRAAASRNEVSNVDHLSHVKIYIALSTKLFQTWTMFGFCQEVFSQALFYSFSLQRAVGLLLRQGAEANARDKFWQTPLHVAAANRATRCAEALLPQLSNLNMADRTGRTALHHAAQSGYMEVTARNTVCTWNRAVFTNHFRVELLI